MGEIFSISPISLPKASPQPQGWNNGDEFFAFFRPVRKLFPSGAKSFSVGYGMARN